MILDILIAIPIVFAFYKGFKNGIIKVIVTLVIVFFGSAVLLEYLPAVEVLISSFVSIPDQWLPVISFVFGFFALLLIGGLLNWVITKFLKVIFLNWVNRLSGALLGAFIAGLLCSFILWFAQGVGMISEENKSNSISITYILPVAPTVFRILPVLQDSVKNVEHLFDKYRGR